MMPAGRGTCCEDCYWNENFNKKLSIDIAAFHEAVFAEEFKKYGIWLAERIGYKKAAQKIHNYWLFFIAIEQRWGAIPKYQDLVEYFGSPALRRLLLPYKWLTTTGRIVERPEVREADSEQRRISHSLARLDPDSSEYGLLEGYYRSLQQSHENGMLRLKSVRLALTPAVEILLRVKISTRPDRFQVSIWEYLGEKPGQKAAISGFVRYLRETYKIQVKLPTSESQEEKNVKRRALEKEILRTLANIPQKTPTKREWLSLALAYFHNLPRSVGRRVPDSDITYDGNGVTVSWRGNNYWVPIQVVP